MTSDQQMISQLVNVYAMSGYEWELGIVETIQALIGIKGERIGDNLLYRIGTGNKKILISAHMDEVGFFVTNVEKKFFRIMPIGDVIVEDLIGEQLVFFSNGVLSKSEIIQPASSFQELKIYGIKDPKIGEVGSFAKKITINKNIITAPSLDNKVGCLTLIKVFRFLQSQPIDASLYFCFSCREEVKTNGVATAVRAINPDFCLDVDSAYAQPISNPQEKQNWQVPTIGAGPAIQLMGKNFITRSSDRRLIEGVCAENNLKFQYEIPDSDNGWTNASTLISAGYETLQINIPVFNQHSSKSETSLTDISETAQLIKNLLLRMCV